MGVEPKGRVSQIVAKGPVLSRFILPFQSSTCILGLSCLRFVGVVLVSMISLLLDLPLFYQEILAWTR